MKSNFHKNVICVDAENPLVEDAAGVQLFCVFVYLSICGFEYLWICGFVYDFTGQQLPFCYQENSKNPIQGRVTPHFSPKIASHGLARGTTGCDINSTDIVRPEFI